MYSQLSQDTWVIEKLKGKRNGFYVDVGASDGIINSNSYMLQKDYGWSGILVEPRRSAYKDLIKRSYGFTQICSGAVVGSDKETQTFIEYPLQELSTLKGYEGNDHLATARVDGIEYIVPCIRLDYLLELYKAPVEIDYLSIDTEGSEFDILRNFDFNKYSIKLITVEHNCTRNKGLINKLMVKNGYILDKSVQWEDWYIKEDLWLKN